MISIILYLAKILELRIILRSNTTDKLVRSTISDLAMLKNK